MFVLCNECHNHYDDAAQTAECAGIGRTKGSIGWGSSSHQPIRSRPVEDHVSAVVRSRSRHRTMPT